MDNSVLLFLISLVAFLLTLFFLLNKTRRINELKSKTDFAVKSDELVRVEMSGTDAPADIARNFNDLGQRVSSYKKSTVELSGVKEKNQSLDSKIKHFEDSLSQLNLLTDIGRQITSSLDVKDIALRLYKYVNSSMIAEEVNILIVIKGLKKYYNVKNNEVEEINNSAWCDDKDNILNWSFTNNREVFLNNASKDFSQYVYKPLFLQSGKSAESIIAIPLNLRDMMMGSVAIMTSTKDSFSDFHLDFSRSMASYVSVAIYNANLFGELGEEKQKSEDLLLNILPQEIANELKEKGKTEAKLFSNVSVLFTDFVNFTGISAKLTPTELVENIDFAFRGFDAISEKYGLEKIKTIGDAYLAVCGLPNENINHANNCIKAALEMINYLKDNNTIFQMRAGINSGPVIAGIVGSKKFAYDIWGDTVNTAARMEQNGGIGRVNISGGTYDLIKDDFKCEHRGKIAAKNKGEIDMYFVDSISV